MDPIQSQLVLGVREHLFVHLKDALLVCLCRFASGLARLVWRDELATRCAVSQHAVPPKLGLPVPINILLLEVNKVLFGPELLFLFVVAFPLVFPFLVFKTFEDVALNLEPFSADPEVLLELSLVQFVLK